VGILRKKRGWIRANKMRREGDDVIVGVGIGRAVTRVYMLDAAETSYSSVARRQNRRKKKRIGYTRRAIVSTWKSISVSEET